MKHKSEHKNIVFRAAAVLFVLVMLSFYLMFGLLARYTSTASGADSAQVACFNVTPGEYYSSPEIYFNDMAPGDDSSHSFTIYSSSDVTVKCLLTIETTGNLPLTYYVDDKVISTDGTFTEIATLTPQGNAEATMSLRAVWNESDNDISYLNEVDAVRLIVTAQQVD